MNIKKVSLIMLCILIIVILVVIIITPNDEKIETSAKNINDNISKQNVDIVMKDTYFITQINDMYYNFNEYEGKTIQIEGFPLTHGEYTFVARYGPGCCVGDGYGLLEYQYNQDISLIDEKDWIKVIGTLKRGFDGETEYIYRSKLSRKARQER